MSVKVLGGWAKGFSLKVPPGDQVRPTSVMLKRRVFDSVQNLEGIIFVDGCAGSGAMGIEAWSRGANEVHLLEKNPKVYKNLEENVKRLRDKYPEETTNRPLKTHLYDVGKWVGPFQKLYEEKKEESSFIFFFDPPYNKTNLYDEVINKKMGIDSWYGDYLWIEADNKKGVKRSFWETSPLFLEKEFTQGDSYLLLAKYKK